MFLLGQDKLQAEKKKSLPHYYTFVHLLLVISFCFCLPRFYSSFHMQNCQPSISANAKLRKSCLWCHWRHIWPSAALRQKETVLFPTTMGWKQAKQNKYPSLSSVLLATTACTPREQSIAHLSWTLHWSAHISNTLLRSAGERLLVCFLKNAAEKSVGSLPTIKKQRLLNFAQGYCGI